MVGAWRSGGGVSVDFSHEIETENVSVIEHTVQYNCLIDTYCSNRARE